MSNFVVNFEQDAGLISDILGINTWQLQTASFNGVSFFIVPASWESYNPFQTITKTATNYLAPNEADPNQNLAADTKLALRNIRDFRSKKLSIRRMPNFNGYFIRDNGADGIGYEMVCLIVGSDYLTGLQNIQNTVNDQSGSGFVFVHPVYGSLQNCYISNFTTLFQSTEWRAATFTMRIMQSGSISGLPVTPTAKSIAGNVLNVITASINDLGRIGADIELAQGFLGRMGLVSYGGQTVQQSPAVRAQQLSDAVKSNQAKLQAATTIVYQQLAKDKLGVTNYTYMNASIDYSNLPAMFRYSKVRTEQFSDLLQYYADSINETYQLYQRYGVDSIWSDNITALRSSLVQLDTFLASIVAKIDNTYKVYTLPADYSVRQVFFYNGLDFNNWNLIQTFFEQNKNIIQDFNIIKRNTSVTLPISNQK